MMFTLAKQSLFHRKTSVILMLISFVVSCSLLISVEHIRLQAKESFSRTVSGVDLIAGPRTGQLTLLLSSVFRVGSGAGSVSWDSYQELSQSNQVAWAVPISLGDSHRGYQVMGTTKDYFEFFRYGNKQSMEFGQGVPFDGLFDVVIGADVADALDYVLGDQLVISHGTGSVSFTHHDATPFTVVGILARTGTPIDKTLHVSLEGIEAMHMSPRQLAQLQEILAQGKTPDIQPEIVSAVFLGLKSRIATLMMQRQIADYDKEPLMAILPGVALNELWQLLGAVENVLLVISLLILFASLLGLTTLLMATLRERQREMAVLRAVGAGPATLFWLIQWEALLVAIVGFLLSVGGVFIALTFIQEWLGNAYGMFISTNIFTWQTGAIAGLVVVATFIIACIPAVMAYRQSLHVGMQSR